MKLDTMVAGSSRNLKHITTIYRATCKSNQYHDKRNRENTVEKFLQANINRGIS